MELAWPMVEMTKTFGKLSTKAVDNFYCKTEEEKVELEKSWSC